MTVPAGTPANVETAVAAAEQASDALQEMTVQERADAWTPPSITDSLDRALRAVDHLEAGGVVVHATNTPRSTNSHSVDSRRAAVAADSRVGRTLNQ